MAVIVPGLVGGYMESWNSLTALIVQLILFTFINLFLSYLLCALYISIKNIAYLNYFYSAHPPLLHLCC